MRKRMYISLLDPVVHEGSKEKPPPLERLEGMSAYPLGISRQGKGGSGISRK